MASAIVNADIDWLKINMFDPALQSQEEICYNYQLFKHVQGLQALQNLEFSKYTVVTPNKGIFLSDLDP